MTDLAKRWAELVATANGRTLVGMAGVRAPGEECEGFSPGEPGFGDCDTDGHYMCVECSCISKRALRRRRDQCEACGKPLVRGPYGEVCAACEPECAPFTPGAP